MSVSKLVFEEETYKVIGACIKVHKNLGNGFSEEVYHEALVKELLKAEIPFEQEKNLPIYYEGSQLNKYYVADFVCFDKIIIEIKSISFLDTNIKQQALNYLKSTNLEVGLLINFGEISLTWKRFIHTPLN
jgi:GxxExxY protein